MFRYLATPRFFGRSYKFFIVKPEALSSITFISKEGSLIYNWNNEETKKELMPYTLEKKQRWDMPSPDPIALEILREMK
jgi:hypothetical protein